MNKAELEFEQNRKQLKRIISHTETKVISFDLSLESYRKEQGVIEGLKNALLIVEATRVKAHLDEIGCSKDIEWLTDELSADEILSMTRIEIEGLRV